MYDVLRFHLTISCILYPLELRRWSNYCRQARRLSDHLIRNTYLPCATQDFLRFDFHVPISNLSPIHHVYIHVTNENAIFCLLTDLAMFYSTFNSLQLLRLFGSEALSAKLRYLTKLSVNNGLAKLIHSPFSLKMRFLSLASKREGGLFEYGAAFLFYN